MTNLSTALSSIIDWLKRWGIYSLGGIIILTIFEKTVEYIVDPFIIQAYNLTAIEIESLRSADYTWVAPMLTVIIVGLIASWRVNVINDKLNKAKNELCEWKNDCKMLVDWRNELKLSEQHLQEELQRIYERDASLNPGRTVQYSNDIHMRQSTPRDTRLGEIIRKLNEIR